MRRVLRYRLQFPDPEPSISNGVRMAVGLMLSGIGLVFSVPVFVGWYGDGVSWWPGLIFIGFAWFLLGFVRFLGMKIR